MVETPRHLASLENEDHPSYDVHECIDLTMRETRDDWSALAPVERHFLRAYEFDSRIQGGGLEDFFYHVNTRQAWHETAEALEVIGAVELLPIFRRMIDKDGKTIEHYLGDEESDGLLLSENYDQQFHDARPGTEFLDKMLYIERLLDAYVRVVYPWRNGGAR